MFVWRHVNAHSCVYALCFFVGFFFIFFIIFSKIIAPLLSGVSIVTLAPWVSFIQFEGAFLVFQDAPRINGTSMSVRFLCPEEDYCRGMMTQMSVKPMRPLSQP